MSKLNQFRWGLLLLLCAAGIALWGSRARPAAGDSAYTSYLPIINTSPLIYLPAIFKDQAALPFQLQQGSPFYLANFINTLGCNWFGVGGRAFGLDGNPVINLTVHLEGGGINTDILTGSAPTALGPGSFVIPLGDHPVASTSVYFIQLRNSLGEALSGVFMIPTYADCNRNFILVNFVPASTPPGPTPVFSTPTS